MCGLAGMIAVHGGRVEPAVLDRMTDVLRHRGPDDSERFVYGSVGLSFRRLTILDLSPSGHQPRATRQDPAAIRSALFAGTRLTTDQDLAPGLNPLHLLSGRMHPAWLTIAPSWRMTFTRSARLRLAGIRRRTGWN
jgi:hypothetical protein